MKKIKITTTNKEKIEALLDEVQKKSSARNLCANEVFAFVAFLEKKFKKMGLPKRLVNGMADFYIPITCNSYKYKGESTIVNVDMKDGEYYLTSAYRSSFGTSRYQKVESIGIHNYSVSIRIQEETGQKGTLDSMMRNNGITLLFS